LSTRNNWITVVIDSSAEYVVVHSQKKSIFLWKLYSLFVQN